MIRRALAAFSLSLSVLLLAALPARAIDIQQVTSPQGIPAWLVEDHSIPFVAIEIAFRGGASVDAPGKRGAIHLMTALLEEGAGEHDAVAYAEAMEALAASAAFDVSDDAVMVGFRTLTENRDAAADLLADALARPRFDPDAVERVRAQALSVIRSQDSDPGSIAAIEMAKRMWGDHPYGSPLTGTAESVSALTRDDLVAAHASVIARDRVIVSAAGDIDAESLGLLLDRILGALPAQATVPLPPRPQLQLTGATTVIDWDSPQTVVRFAQAGLPLDDPDYFAAVVLNHILGGGGFSSRLMDEIREKRGLTYGVGTSLSNQVLGDSWGGGMDTANDRTAEAVALVREIWGTIRDGVTEQELADAKTYLTGEYPLRFDGNRRISGILTGMQLMDMPPDYINTRNDRVRAVTAEDVHRVAQRMLDPKALEFVLVGRPSGIDGSAAAP